LNGLVVAIIFMFIVMWGCVTCTTTSSERQYSQTNITVAADASADLNLKAVGELARKVASAEEFERKLNEPNGVNNLDLNEDGKVDFIKVTEYGNGKDQFGFSLTTEPVKGEVQEVAKIEIIKEGEQVRTQITGNRHIYGPGMHYGFLDTAVNVALLAYLLSPHRAYVSPFGWGAYPSYYRSYPPSSYSAYRNRMNSYTSGSRVGRMSPANVKNTGIASPNQGKTASKGITRTLKNPTSTQRAFQARNPSKTARSGGFGKSARGGSSRGFGGRGK